MFNMGFHRLPIGAVPQGMGAGGHPGSRPVAVLATLAAVAFGLRAVIELPGEVTYWDPQTPRDYAAVALTSLALLFLGGTLWAMGRTGQRMDTRTRKAARVSRVSLRTAAAAALVVSFSNFLEDFLRLRWFGTTFVAGILVLSLALLTATVARFAATPRKAPAEALLLLAITAGVVFLSLSMFLACLALLAVAAYYARSRITTVRPPSDAS